MTNPNQNVARIVRVLLTHQGKTRTDLARSLNVHVSAVSKALNGRRSWSVDDIQTMAEFFDVSPALFFEEADTVVRSRWFRRLDLGFHDTGNFAQVS